MKKHNYLKKFFIVLFFIACMPVWAQQKSEPVDLIIHHYSTRNFVSGAIPDADINLIVQAGVRAPSARNLQPWHFTVVQNPALTKKIITGCDDGNIVIVVSAQGDGKTNNVQIIDCSLAVQSIYLAAQALGYGSRIYTGPIAAVNKNLKTDLSLPNGHSAIALIRIGKIKEPAPDAISAASARKKAEEVVTYKK